MPDMKEEQAQPLTGLVSTEEDAWGKGWKPEHHVPEQQHQNQPYFLGSRIYERPNDYLVWSILAMFLCFLPSGAVGLYYSCYARRDWKKGNINGAYRASKNARMWAYISLAIGIMWWITLAVALCILLIASYHME